jgi:hypothetical protein
VVDVYHVISMLGVGISPASLFILDRIYTLLHTGCPPDAMFSRCASCLFNSNYLKLIKVANNVYKQVLKKTSFTLIISSYNSRIYV